MRAFVAIEMPDGVRAILGGLVARLRSRSDRVSWVKPDNIHLTLRFLGEVDGPHLQDLSQRILLVTEHVRPFTLHIGGLGTFPNPRRPKVIWVGVTSSDNSLEQVQRGVELAARAIGLPAETHRFSPHITLGRVRDDRQSGDLRALVERESTFDAGDIEVRRVALLKSELSPQGSIYTVIREFSFPWT